MGIVFPGSGSEVNLQKVLETVVQHGHCIAEMPGACKNGEIVSVEIIAGPLSSGREIVLLDPTQDHQPLALLDEQAGRVSALAFADDGQYLVSAHEDGSLCLWQVASRQLGHCVLEPAEPVTRLSFSPRTGRLITLAPLPEHSRIRFWQIAPSASGQATLIPRAVHDVERFLDSMAIDPAASR